MLLFAHCTHPHTIADKFKLSDALFDSGNPSLLYQEDAKVELKYAPYYHQITSTIDISIFINLTHPEIYSQRIC